MSTFLLASALIVAVIAITVAMLIRRRKTDIDAYPYISRGHLFTDAERSFMAVLSQAVAGKAYLLGKVSVADVLTPKPTLPNSEKQSAQNRINSKHFDFVLCRIDTMQILCAIELNDRSHKSAKRQARDEFLRGACASANIPLQVFQTKYSYSVAEIRKSLAVVLASTPDVGKQSEHAADPSHRRFCAKCSSLMVTKTAKKGKFAGKQFLACSNFPDCRSIQAIS